MPLFSFIVSTSAASKLIAAGPSHAAIRLEGAHRGPLRNPLGTVALVGWRQQPRTAAVTGPSQEAVVTMDSRKPKSNTQSQLLLQLQLLLQWLLQLLLRGLQ